jgi:hypothetical protein
MLYFALIVFVVVVTGAIKLARGYRTKVRFPSGWYNVKTYFTDDNRPYIIHQERRVYLYDEDCVYVPLNWKIKIND